MRIDFNGAAQTVTGSQHLLTINGHRILLDCGLYQGPRRKTYERNQNFPFKPRDVDAVILSHAHIDHCGNLPNLVRQNYTGPIYATHATNHITRISLLDSAHIQEADAAYINKRRKRQGKPPIEPLYSVADAENAVEQLVEQPYDQPFQVAPGVLVTLVEAGHILGSAGVVLDLEENGRRERVMFSGDIGRRDIPILRDPVMPKNVDYLLMECTYGDRPHDDFELAMDGFRRVIRRTLRRGGKVIIPAFAVGRTQLLVYALHRMVDSGEIPRVPIFVDSPMAINVTDVFREHPECFDRETLAFMETDPHGSAFGFDMLSYTRSVRESKAINDRREPMVIISASGMAEVGRILHHLKNNIGDSRNTVLITSWMAPHTLGRRLVEGVKRVKIFGEEYEVRAEVAHINGFSAHAGQQLLLKYALATKDTLKRLFLVHGEEEAAEELTEELAQAGLENVSYPFMDQGIEL